MVESCLNSPAINCDFVVFQQGKTLVEINLVGAVLPIAFSVFILILYRKRLPWIRLVEFTILGFLIITAMSSTVTALHGGIFSTPGWLVVLYVILMVSLFTRLRVVRTKIFLVMGELYVIGTFSVLLDDASRTLLGPLGIPDVGLNISPSVWGGAGPADVIFTTGIYLAIIYLGVAVSGLRSV
jgi:hypothetical protein